MSASDFGSPERIEASKAAAEMIATLADTTDDPGTAALSMGATVLTVIINSYVVESRWQEACERIASSILDALKMGIAPAIFEDEQRH